MLIPRKSKSAVRFTLLFLVACCLIPVQPTMVGAAKTKPSLPAVEDTFPLYPSIKPNVDFWVRIFTTVSENQGLVHDARNLNRVYDTIQLDSAHTPAARKKNRAVKKKAVNTYKAILLRFAANQRPSTEQEKRVWALFKGKPDPDVFRQAAYNIRIQTGLKEEFKNGLVRSGAYLSRFKKIFTAYGLPEDLVYLPCVESSFRTDAYSKFGAAGIWQFTHGTGRQYMDIGYVVDERRDPFIATDAAARLLKKNFEELKAWPLAITAYNHGLNGMKRATQLKGSYENIFNTYRSRSFQFASRNFYSEFLAARQVAKNARTYFGTLAVDPVLSFQVIKINGFLSVDDALKTLELSQAQLHKLNPALRKPVFNGQKYIPKGFDLKVPDTVNKKSTAVRLSAHYKSRQKPSRFHRVQKGDTAGKVAQIHGVSLHDLILANGLNRRATIYIGQNLRIPVKGEHMAAAAAPEIQNTAISLNSTPKKKASVEPPANIPAAPAPVPVPAKEPPAAEPPQKVVINPEIITANLKVAISKNRPDIGSITVQPEETLGHYADWLGIKTHSIRKLNRFTFGTPISIDQTVKLPLQGISVQEFEEKRYEFHKEMEEDFFESFTIQGTENYRVKPGDNIWTLCMTDLEVPFWLLKKYNPGTGFQNLKPMQTLVYPLIEKKQL